MSPQILRSAEYSIKCDVWSLGVMFYEILTGTLPWLVPTKSSTMELLDKILNEPLEFPKSLPLTA
jgi:serine/threonine protein kinase